MKRVIITFFALIIVSQPVFAGRFDCFITKYKERQNLKSVERFLNKQVRYANNNNYDKFLATYAENYMSNDGFDKKIYGKLIKSVWDSFKDIKYNISIKEIDISNNIATAKLIETSFAEIDLNNAYPGELKSISNTIYKMQKDKKGNWKVISDEVLDEMTTMLYGNAQLLNVKLTVPESVKANADYTASLEFSPPNDTIAIASLAADKVEYPQKPTKEVFRPLPEDNILERIFTSNNDNANEYVIATIGLTKADINDTSVQLKLTGFGYAIKRINVIPKGDANVENK